eukprot:scaffold613_cov152-Isochrysis_galbana.AAC.4
MAAAAKRCTIRTSCQHGSACRSSHSSCPAWRTRKPACWRGGGAARSWATDAPNVSCSPGCTQSSHRSDPTAPWTSRKSRRATSKPQ